MRVLPLVTVFFLTSLLPLLGLVLANENEAPVTEPRVALWQESLDTRAVVHLSTPFGVTASGVFLEGGTHVLTAAHVASCVPPEMLEKGLVVFANAEGQRRHWKSVTFHPAAKTAQLQQIWDVVLIELAGEVPAAEVPGLSLAETSLQPGQLVALTGFGQSGSGRLGAYEDAGRFGMGFNHFEKKLNEDLCRQLRLAVGEWPVWTHNFDAGSELGVLEAHFGNGDSGGAGLVLAADGSTRLASLNLARHRGLSDSDHRLNGSFGEVGLSIDARALLPWIADTFSKYHAQKIKQVDALKNRRNNESKI